MTMHAEVGDWLVINSHSEGRPVRRAAIVGVGTAGGPPYRVRWTDTDHESLVFPGPDAAVVSAAEQAERDRVESERITHLQSAIKVNTGRR
jgi:hypothetical protein